MNDLRCELLQRQLDELYEELHVRSAELLELLEEADKRIEELKDRLKFARRKIAALTPKPDYRPLPELSATISKKPIWEAMKEARPALGSEVTHATSDQKS